MSTLIPFAINRESGELCGVEDVPRGRSCNCVCPSCGQSVVARRGEKVEWHFAHDSRAEVMAEKECELSFELVCAQMLRQMLLDAKNEPLALPVYEEFLCLNKGGYKRRDSITITEASTNSVSEYKEFSIPYTLIATIQNHKLLLDIIHRERVAISLDDYPDKVSGHLEFDVSDYLSSLESKVPRGITYKAAMRRWVTEEVIAKRWLNHKRKERQLDKLRKELNKSLDNEIAHSKNMLREQRRTSRNADNSIGVHRYQRVSPPKVPSDKYTHEAMRRRVQEEERKEKESRRRLLEGEWPNTQSYCPVCKHKLVAQKCSSCSSSEYTRASCQHCVGTGTVKTCPNCGASTKNEVQVFSG
ncbi:competence protein CoiA family protein [Microbulbifer sp. JMSA004]|uniref:competence protein CoiA family protein n=1 Tax=Microbulbifer sp. JMSA004 TaxID=3243370 RepID=UPI00403A38D7